MLGITLVWVRAVCAEKIGEEGHIGVTEPPCCDTESGVEAGGVLGLKTGEGLNILDLKVEGGGM